MNSLAETLHQRFQVLSPLSLFLIDKSAQHKGHIGAQTGSKHFSITIVSAHFQGLPLIKRHQLVYDLVKDLIPHPLHALEIEAKTP